MVKIRRFDNKIKEVWEPFDGSLIEPTPLQFHKNLKRLKKRKIAMIWSKEKSQRGDKTLKEVGDALVSLYNSDGFDYITKIQKVEIKQLKDKKRLDFF